MSDAVQLAPSSLKRGRQSKFTPERVQQIINLVERGKSRDEIAEIVGVTSATLQVTCSKLGISLRRKHFNVGTGLLPRHPVRANHEVRDIPSRDIGELATPPDKAGKHRPTAGEPSVGNEIISAPPNHEESKSKTDRAAGALEIRMLYKGQARTIELPLTPKMLSKLACEAEFRELRITELLVKTILHVAEKDMFGQVLADQQTGGGKLRLVTAPRS